MQTKDHLAIYSRNNCDFRVKQNTCHQLKPKLAWSEVGSLWGLGLSSNIQILPNLELVPEANFALNKATQSNATLGIRWHAEEDFSIDFYASTAASILEIGELMSADEIRWGTRLTFTF